MRTENVIDVGKHCTVDELWKEVPVHFPVTIGSQTKNNKVYKKHIQPLYGSKDIRDITQLDVQQTVRNVKTDWHRIFQVAQINKIAVMDLTTLVKTPEAMKTTERSVREENITAEDFDSFISFMNEYGGFIKNIESIEHFLRSWMTSRLDNSPLTIINEQLESISERYKR